MDRKRYPKDWAKIATEIKEAADWKCQKCGKQCRRPGESFDTHRRTLTVAHLNHVPEDMRPENLMAMCAPCHLRYDAKHHAETRRIKRRSKMIGIVGSCGSCKYFEEAKLITGYCRKHDGETAIFGNCEYFEPKIVHENEVMKKMETDNGH